jgi:hypothetical protein
MMTTRRKPKTVTTPELGRRSAPASTFVSHFDFPSALTKLLLIFFCLSPVGIVPSRSAAQNKKEEKPYALIYGTVWGPDSHPLYGVTVKIRSADHKKAHWELYSDHQGEFAQRVPVGPADYVVWTDLKNYKGPQGKSLRLPEDVKVHITYDEREDIGLHLTY